MAHVPSHIYEQWAQDLTGLPLSVKIVKHDPPYEMLSIVHERVGEVLRLRTIDVTNYASFGEALPYALDADDKTVWQRLDLLTDLSAEPDLLAVCQKEIPAFVDMEKQIAQEPFSLEKQKTNAALAARMSEARRQLELLLLRVDETSILHALRIVERLSSQSS